ncbi:MAG: PIN domain-containing protein [Candidatus Aminicenantes bacterium]|nr:PIN domain-containing protein [Candidatus Aminicenantes bacterium]
MTRLLDVNVLIALTWPNHVHHDAAQSWFKGVRSDGWATCPLTEGGFVRISCNPSAVKQAATPADAIRLLEKLRELESHSFWPMDRSIADLPPGILRRIQGYRQISDAVLLALAIQYRGQLATFDSGFASHPAREELSTVHIIPV